MFSPSPSHEGGSQILGREGLGNLGTSSSSVIWEVTLPNQGTLSHPNVGPSALILGVR